MTTQTLTIGPARAEERCAQLGVTRLLEQANLLEIGCYRAALTVCHGQPPVGAAFHIERTVHDFGTDRELAVRFDPDDEAATARACPVEDGLSRWLDADFLAPVVYDDRSQVAESACTDRFDAARTAMLLMDQLRTDGCGPFDQAIRIAHLRGAYPAQAEDVGQLLRQLATETRVRGPDDHRGVHYPKGDAIDVHAQERRAGRCRHILADLGSVRTADEALYRCWEHLARYVVH